MASRVRTTRPVSSSRAKSHLARGLHHRAATAHLLDDPPVLTLTEATMAPVSIVRMPSASESFTPPGTGTGERPRLPRWCMTLFPPAGTVARKAHGDIFVVPFGQDAIGRVRTGSGFLPSEPEHAHLIRALDAMDREGNALSRYLVGSRDAGRPPARSPGSALAWRPRRHPPGEPPPR